jgi:anti-sigma regulatory factor (Ser/Thr protein kinase)
MERVATAAGLNPAMTMSLNLALEEAVTNVIMYAYPKGTEGPVDIDATLDGGELCFVLSDSGTPFDPTAAPEADISLGVEERPIGGLGIFLVRKIMDQVTYQYTGGRNTLKMLKKI